MVKRTLSSLEENWSLGLCMALPAMSMKVECELSKSGALGTVMSSLHTVLIIVHWLIVLDVLRQLDTWIHMSMSV